ncbi:MAG: hypothetical protein N2318_10935 [Meiothermus sp.]|nr:hypothetical protein [Meiothermus sp.]
MKALILTPDQIRRMKVRTLENPPQMTVRLEAHEMHWQILDRAGRVVREAEQPIHNLILDQTYTSLMPTHGIIPLNQYAVVGTGSTAPNSSQTGLVSELVRTGSVPAGESDQAQFVSDGVYDIRRVKEFTEAQVGGQNLTEWGFSPSASAGANLMCRELFRDGSSNPITLTLAGDQRLRLIYKMRVTVGPTVVQAVTVNIGGEGPGSRTAQFIVTNRMGGLSGGGSLDSNPIYGGISFPINSNTGDLQAAHCLIKGANGDGSGYNSLRFHIGAATGTAPTTYGHATSSFSPHLGLGSLTHAAPSGRSRQSSFLADTATFNGSIKSVCLSCNNAFNTLTPTINLVFDSGQEFTKANTHKLLIANYQITW